MDLAWETDDPQDEADLEYYLYVYGDSIADGDLFAGNGEFYVMECRNGIWTPWTSLIAIDFVYANGGESFTSRGDSADFSGFGGGGGFEGGGGGSSWGDTDSRGGFATQESGGITIWGVLPYYTTEDDSGADDSCTTLPYCDQSDSAYISPQPATQASREYFAQIVSVSLLTNPVLELDTLGDPQVLAAVYRILGATPLYEQDGQTFENWNSTLPVEPDGYYVEWTVQPPSGTARGTRRLVIGLGGEIYYTEDHYTTFVRVL